MSAGSLPYFKFYPGDWLSDFHVRAMEPADRGIYIDLLAFDWEEGGLPDDPEILAKVVGVDAERMRNAWEKLSARFIDHPNRDGWVTNRRLHRERKDIQDRAEKRSEAARKAAQARWEKEKSDADDADASKSHSDGNAITRSREKSEDRSKKTDTTDSGEDSQRSSSPSSDGPHRWMHEIWHEELGYDGHPLKLTEKRRKKYRRLYEEHLEAAPRPEVAYRAILRRVQESDHHMSERSYQMPESLFRNEERRDQWVQRTVEWLRKGGKTGKKARQREKLADEIEARRSR